jgi:hypothetical protein
MAKKPEMEFLEPNLIEMPSMKMAVVVTVGDPNHVSQDAMKALFGAVYKIKFSLKKEGIEFKVDALRARWPNAHLVPKDQWEAHWAIPVPEDTGELVQKVPGFPVKLETWQYGTVAQILHQGPFSTEGPTVQRLHDFISQSGYEFNGVHEEHYLTKMDSKDQRTLIRYPVRVKSE